MDLQEQHEAFLRAIFDAPDDDTTRLVYADFLEECGESEHAEFIRVQCELSSRFPHGSQEDAIDDYLALSARSRNLYANLSAVDRNRFPPGELFVRGFGRQQRSIRFNTTEFANLDKLRQRLVADTSFSVTDVSLKGPRLSTGHIFDAMFNLAALAKMTSLDVSGEHRSARGVEDGPDGLRLTGHEVAIVPVMSVLAVEALAQHSGTRRLTCLDLSDNNLDDDAAHALIKSPYLGNIMQLRLRQGNRLRGRVWQKVTERFGIALVD